MNGELRKWFTLASHTGEALTMPQFRKLSQMKDSYEPDITASWTGTSLCTYAIEPPCTDRYARWRERSVTQLMSDLLLDFHSSVNDGIAIRNFHKYRPECFSCHYMKIIVSLETLRMHLHKRIRNQFLSSSGRDAATAD